MEAIMGKSLLHDFLELGLLDIAADDEKFEYLQKTSQEISKKLAKKKIDIIGHVLVALDPHVAPDNPILLETEAALIKHWSTFRNKFRDIPRQMLRPIIFEALRYVGESDPACASIIWLSGGSYLPHANIGKEKGLCTNFIVRMGQSAESKAAEEWAGLSVYPGISLPSLSLKLDGVSKVVVDEAKLAAHMGAAAGPNSSGPIGENPNQYWPSQNAAWLAKFAERGAKGLSEVISDSVNALPITINKSLSGLNTELGEFVSAMNAAITEAVNHSIKSSMVDQRRNRLLWWKETLYSPSLQKGYRTLEPVLAAFTMACDLHSEVPAYSPSSVEYLLRESVRSMTGLTAKGSGSELQKLIDEVASGADTQSLKKSIGTASNFQGRKPLLGAIQAALAGETNSGKQLTMQLGLKSDTPVTLEDFSVWIFRDLQAQRLAAMK